MGFGMCPRKTRGAIWSIFRRVVSQYFRCIRQLGLQASWMTWSYPRWWQCLLATGLLLGAPVISVSMAQEEVVLKVPLSAVSLSEGEKVCIPVVVENHGSTSLQGLSLEVYPPQGMEVGFQRPSGERLEPRSGMAWILSLKRAAEGRLGLTRLLLRYQRTPEGERAAVPGVAVTEFLVEEAQPPLIRKVANVTTHSALKVLEDLREGGLVFLVVDNLLSVPLEVIEVHSYQPDFVAVKLLSKKVPEIIGGKTGGREKDGAVPTVKLPLVVPAGNSRVLPYVIVTRPPVEPGEQTVLWEMDVAWNDGNMSRRSTLVAKHDFSVSVLGSSALLEAVKVPSLFMLPGALVVMTIVFLRRRWAPRVETKLSVFNPEFWLVAVAISIGAIYGYRWFTAWLGQPRDYMARYGVEDIFRLWLGSLAGGFLIYLLLVGREALWRRFQAYRRSRWLPTPNDSPVELLRKLARNGMGLELPQIRWENDDGAHLAFELLTLEDGTHWLAPLISLRWGNRNDELRMEVNSAISNNNPLKLADLLETAEKIKVCRVDWESSGPSGLNHPIAVSFAHGQLPHREAATWIVTWQGE